MKRQLRIGILTLLLIGMIPLRAHTICTCMPSQEVLWAYSTGGDYVNCVEAIEDINGDGKQDVVVGTIYSFRVSCFSGDTGMPLWSQFVEGRVLSLVIIEDVDDDGKQDVLAGIGYPDPGIKCLSGLTGTILWSYSTLTSLYLYGGMHNGVTFVCVINDVNGDGCNDVVAGTEKVDVLCLDGKNGSLIWSYMSNDYVHAVLNIGDADNDGKHDAVVMLQLEDDTQFGTYCLSGNNGTIIWSRVDNGYVWASDVIDDVDQDLQKDVVVGVNTTDIICISGSSGSLIWTYSLPLGYGISMVKVIDDVNADGKPEVVVSGGRKTVCISGFGEFVWSYEASGEIWALGFIDDVDGDGRSEVIAGTFGYWGAYDKNETLCISGASSGVGKLIWLYTMSDGASAVSSINDVDDDGKQDVIVGTMEREGKVHIVSGGSEDTGKLIWSRQCGSMVWRLTPINDVNDDGKQDVVAYSGNWKIHVISGADGSLLWSRNSYRFDVIDDVNEDNKPEVIIRDDDELLCLSGDKGTVIWSQPLSHGMVHVLNIDDVDSDGKREILLVTGGYSPTPYSPRWLYDIYCISGSDGTTIWSFAANRTMATTYPIPVPGVVDVNGDDKEDVILTATWCEKYMIYHHELLSIDGNSAGLGTLLWRREVPAEIDNLIVVGDADYDSIRDIVSTTTDGKVLCFNGGTGSPIWIHQAEASLKLIFPIEDVDNDSIPDIVTHNGLPLNKTFCLSGGNGTLIWSYITSYPALGHWLSPYLYKTYTIDDINADGKQEVLMMTGYPDELLYCISGGDGVPIWTAKLGRNIRFFDVTDDVDGDDSQDILVSATNRTAYCVSGSDGSILWKFLGQGYVAGMWQTDDLNGDGMRDFFVASGKIYGVGGLLWDTTPPIVANVTQQPTENSVYPDDKVMVYVNITDDQSGLKRVILNYTTNNGTWFGKEMTNLEGITWNTTIPECPYGTNVTYLIMAEDNANNSITTEEMGYRYHYLVIPEFPSFLILPLFMMSTLLAVIVYRRKHSISREG